MSPDKSSVQRYGVWQIRSIDRFVNYAVVAVSISSLAYVPYRTVPGVGMRQAPRDGASPTSLSVHLSFRLISCSQCSPAGCWAGRSRCHAIYCRLRELVDCSRMPGFLPQIYSAARCTGPSGLTTDVTS